MKERKIFITGLPRSGSTFLWQCIRKMIHHKKGEYSLDRNHGGLHSGNWDFPIFTCRNIFDVVKSLSLTHEIPIKEVVNQGFFNEYLDGFIKDYKKGIVIKYENYLPHDPMSLILYIQETIFGAKLEKSITNEIVKEYSIENNKKRSYKYKSFSEYDKKDSMIHGKHITSNGIGLGTGISDDDRKIIAEHPKVEEYIKIFDSL